MENETVQDTATEVTEAPETGATEAEAPAQSPQEAAFAAAATGASDTETTEQQEARKYADRFDSPEAMEKSYLELEAKLKEDGKLYEVPESYAAEETLAAGGINPPANEAEQATLDALMEGAKEAGFTQRQFDAMIKLGADWARRHIEMSRPDVDHEAEFSKLQSEWRTDDKATRARIDEVAKWAVANLPSEVFNKPLYASAEGLKFLDQLRTQQRGPQPLSGNTAAPGPSLEEIKLERANLMADPEYMRNTPKGKALNDQVDALLAKEAKLRGR
jgi:hypothetical protein